MTSPDQFHNRSVVAWLESNLPQPEHVSPELQKIFGPNPLIHLAPIIAEYLGPNPFYCVPDSPNFQIREKVKSISNEKNSLFDQYDAFFHEMQRTNTPMIPTPFPRFDDVLMTSINAQGIELPAMPIQQRYVESLLKKYHKFSRPGSNYLYRYLPPMQQNAIHTYSMTGSVTLHDGSLLMANEANLLLWPARYTPPSTTPAIVGENPLDVAIDRELAKGGVIDIHQIYKSIPEEEKTAFLRHNPHMGDLYQPEFEDVYEEMIKREGQQPTRQTIIPNQQQNQTNKSMVAYLLDTTQQNNAIFRRNRIKNILPHLEQQPQLVHSFDLATNQWNSDIFLDKLPHQLSNIQLKIWKRRKREFLTDALADDSLKSANHRQLTDAFFEANGLPLLDEDQLLIDDLSDNGEGSFSDEDSDEDDEDEDEDDSDYSSSGDNDSSSEGESRGKKARYPRRRICCPHGHSKYTALSPIEPLYHINPADDYLLRNYGISMHSSRLFVTGCAEGHIVLHDGLTGFCRVIGQSKYPIVQLSIISTHQHASELPSDLLTGIVTNMEQYNFAKKIRNQHQLAPKYSQDDQRAVSSSETIYHPTNRVFPIIVSLDQIGEVAFWDTISGLKIASYSQDRVDSEQRPTSRNGKQPLPYNYTGMMKMSMCSIPLLPHVQRMVRYGPQRIRPPAKTAYASATSSVVSMIFYPKKNGEVQIPNPQYDVSGQPWSPFIGFPFEYASPRLNSGLLAQLTDPEKTGYVEPFLHPETLTITPPSSQLNLVTPIRGTFSAPSVVVTPFAKGQLTFCDLKNIACPTFYTFAHKQHVTCIAYIGGLLWTAGWDCVVKSWDLRYLSTPVHTIQCAKKHITALTGLDDKYIVIASAEKEMKIFDIEQLAINRTYANHVLNHCEEYIRSIDFRAFEHELQENDQKLENLRQKFIAHQEKKLNKDQKTAATGDIPSPNASSSSIAKIGADGEVKFDSIYEELGIALEDRPKSVSQLLQNDPFESSPFHLMSVYPSLVYTQLFQQWLITNNITYAYNRFLPLITSYDLNTGGIISNLTTARNNNGFTVPIARNQNQRIEYSLGACLFDWDVDELIQHIMVSDGVIFTLSKECKAKVGLNKLVGSMIPWVTSIDLTDGDDIQ